MLKRIVAITFVALLSLPLAGTSIADPKKTDQENKKQAEAMKGFQKALEGNSIREAPKGSTGPTVPPKPTQGTKNK